MSDAASNSAADAKSQVQRSFIQHSAQIRGFITALMPDLASVDDVFQETFLVVTDKAETFDRSRDFLAWACGIARMKVREAGRKLAGKWKPLSDEVLEALAACEPPPADDDERIRHLEVCLNSLAPQARRIIELNYQQAHKPAEIAKRMEWSVESVYVALSRARALLRQCIDRKLTAGGTP